MTAMDVTRKAQVPCTQEPIHIPGHIQPHGCLLAFSHHDLAPVCLSQNVAHRAMDLGFDRLPDGVRSALTGLCGTVFAHRTVMGDLAGFGWREFNCFSSPQAVFCEFETDQAQADDAGFLSDFDDLHDRFTAVTDSNALFAETAQAVRAMSGFERVMIYRFDDEGDGEVVGESLADDWPQSFLGLRFPASDIPPQARALYVQNPIRWMPTCDYQPVPLVSGHDQPFDIRLSRFRSMSPVHRLYQHTIGVDGAMSASIMRAGRLWGLVIGHHRRPHRVPLAVQHRVAALVHIVSMCLDALLSRQEGESFEAESQRYLAILSKLAAADDYQAALLTGEPSIIDLIPGCTGASVVWTENDAVKVRSLGSTPTDTVIADIAQRCFALRQDGVFATDHLTGLDAGYHCHRAVASGVLVGYFDDPRQTAVLLFRPEQVRLVAWAGKPEKSIDPDGSPNLPRRSFDRWVETKQGHAIGWSAWDRRIVGNLCMAVSGVILRQTRRIQELTQAQDALREQEMRVHLLLDCANDGIYGVDINGNVTFANPAVTRIYGWSHDELLGKNIHDLVCPCQADQTAHPKDQCPVSRAMTDNDAYEANCAILYRKDKTSFPAEVVAAPIVSDKGILGAVVVVHDVTRQHQYEADLRRSNAELEQFSYVISHDMREPLRMISSYMGLLERHHGATLGAEGLEFLAFAKDGALRLDRMIRDLLNYSRLGHDQDIRDAVSLADVTDEALQNLTALIEGNGAVVTVDPDLPVVSGNRTKLVQLMQNLIGNALKYRSKDRRPQVSVAAHPGESGWHITVSDNGIGIDAEHFDRIFAVFQRLHGHGDVDGTGIGLAVCRKIVQQHGGRIWVQSQPDVGSAFTFTIA